MKEYLYLLFCTHTATKKALSECACMRCMSPNRSEMGVFGRVCRHCKLDEGMRTWEARLFQLSTKALAAGTQVRHAGKLG